MVASPVDWRHEARTLICAGMGVRETARKLELPEERVKKWATRAGVCAEVAKARVAVSLSPRSPIVPKASEILRESLADYGKTSKLAIAKRGAIVLSAAAERAEDDPEKALAESPLIAAEVKSQQGANVPGFERQVETATAVQVNVALASMLPSPELECIESPIIDDAFL